MKIALLSGAVKNAGDYLIEDCTHSLLEYVYPNSSIQIFKRNESLANIINKINCADMIIFGGGPMLGQETYPDVIPLLPELNDILPPIYTLGIGWYGKNTLDWTLYEDYKFGHAMKQLVGRMHETYQISCRDWYTYRLLRNSGYSNIVMTGCPAWYNLSCVENDKLRTDINIPYKKIIVSDPGYSINMNLAYDIVYYLRNKFQKAQIHFVFHRGIKQDENTSDKRARVNIAMLDKLAKLHVYTHDISYGLDGFSVYDDCDLHIGFRVHAHIYNLSKRSISILMEEDARGAGVNEALGLTGIKPYSYTLNKNNGKVSLDNNEYVIQVLDDYLASITSSGYIQLRNSFRMMKEYFNIMVEHIKGFER
ncbi:MAG: hypothetical protein H6Q69_279 [Firmicutes bacterium]|nr:hypothetical protein [Bacillota bacterium]